MKDDIKYCKIFEKNNDMLIRIGVVFFINLIIYFFYHNNLVAQYAAECGILINFLLRV